MEAGTRMETTIALEGVQPEASRDGYTRHARAVAYSMVRGSTVETSEMSPKSESVEMIDSPRTRAVPR